MATFRVKLHDTTLPLSASTDLSGATVKAFIRTMSADGQVPATVPVVVTDAPAGYFDLIVSDVDAGEFDLEVLVTRDDEQVRIPSMGFDRLVVGRNLDDPLAAPYEPSLTLRQVIEETFAGEADRIIPFAAAAQEAAVDAGTFAAATEFDADRAGQSAFQSGQSAGYALGHRNAAQASAESAQAAATSITKDVPGGVPSLDGNARVPDARMPERLSLQALLGTIDAAVPSIGSAIFAARNNNTLMALGDSITANGGGLVAPGTLVQNFNFQAVGYPIWANLLSGGRFKFLGSAATPGYTTAQILATHVPTVLALKPRYCVVCAGQNSQGDLASYLTIVQTLVAAGITPILATVPATGTGAALLKLNAYIRKLATVHSLPIVDFYRATVDPASGLYRSGYSGDGIHPTEAGAKAMGQALADVVTGLISVAHDYAAPRKASANTDSTLAFTNPLFLTDNAAAVPLATGASFLASFKASSFATVAGIAGRAWSLVRGTANGIVRLAALAPANGDRIELSVAMSSTVKAVGGTVTFRLEDSSNGQPYVAFGFSEDIPAGSRFAIEWVAPSDRVSANQRVTIQLQGAENAAVQIGEFTARNLSALALP